jgi:hypothetical protein
MSKDKELSADVKTVLHGEVLGPDEDAAYSHTEKRQKVKMIMDDPLFQEQNSRMAQHYQNQWYQQQQYNPFKNQYMGNMMGGQVGGLFNALVFDFLFRRK